MGTPKTLGLKDIIAKYIDHQKEIIRMVCKNMQTGFFIAYTPMINSGKTTSVVPA